MLAAWEWVRVPSLQKKLGSHWLEDSWYGFEAVECSLAIDAVFQMTGYQVL